MKKYTWLSVFLFWCFNILSEQTYCAGEQITQTHQNQVHVVGAGADGYETGDLFRLSDYNGDLNGGEYHVIFIDMSASW